MHDLDNIKNIVPYENKIFNEIIKSHQEHKEMLNLINQSLPSVLKNSEMFYKTQSQFMDNMLTVSHPTPIRNIRQILAEMNKTREALKEAHFKVLKSETNIKIKKKELELEKDELKQELLELEIAELYCNNESAKGYISGAIRKLTNYTNQYNSIIEKHNLKNINEIDFEQEEERYHIMKAFEQGINAARSHGGTIDEGNFIYFTQIGINGATAQRFVDLYLNDERTLLSQNQAPTHEMFLSFLNQMADRFKGCSKAYAEYKGMNGTMTELAAIK